MHSLGQVLKSAFMQVPLEGAVGFGQSTWRKTASMPKRSKQSNGGDTKTNTMSPKSLEVAIQECMRDISLKDTSPQKTSSDF